MGWFFALENWLNQMFGYNFVVHFEDIVQTLAGVFIGMVIAVFLIGNGFDRTYKVERLGNNQFNFATILKAHGRKIFMTDPHSLSESIEAVILIGIRPLCKIKKYTLRDERRTRRVIIILSITGIALIILSSMCIFSIYTPQ